MDFNRSQYKKVRSRYILLAGLFLFQAETSVYAFPKTSVDLSQLKLFLTGTVGASKLSTNQSQHYDSPATCFYNYSPTDTSSSMLGGGTLGMEIKTSLSYLYGIDVGVSYYGTGAYSLKGQLHQGVDAISTSNYQYSYSIKSRQVMLESKFLFKVKNKIFPYLSVGVGDAFNEALSYKTNVPSFFEFTPNFPSHSQQQFAYLLGTGIDLDLQQGFRLGAGYRFTDSGFANLGGGVIDNVPTSFALKQHLYSNQLFFQVTFTSPALG